MPVRDARQPDVSGHIAALDAVRGIAILMVLFLHFSGYDPLPAPNLPIDRAFEKVASLGWIGVDLFFVLSGFLITGILYDSKGSDHYLRNFYARRILRIFPIYYLTLFVFLVLLPHAYPGDRTLRGLQHDGLWYWTYLTNVRIALTGSSWFGALGHFWSLAVEEQFYLVWPFVILLFRRSNLIRICLLSIAGALAVRVTLMLAGYEIASCVVMPARMDALAVGGILALVARGPDGLVRAARLARPAAVLAATMLTSIVVWRGGLVPTDPVITIAGYPLLAVLFGAVIVLGVTAPAGTVLGRIGASRTLSFFGRYSYGLYVFHHPILFFNLAAFLFLDRVPLVFGSLLLRKFVFIAAAMALSVALALVSWHLCEKNCLKLKRLFADDRASRARASVPTARTAAGPPHADAMGKAVPG